jgi:hypothetical protein
VLAEQRVADAIVAEGAKHGIVWLNTAPDPRRPATGFDAGRSSWKYHAVRGDEKMKISALRWERTLCGVLPAHGYDLDLFIPLLPEYQCRKCLRAYAKLTAEK